MLNYEIEPSILTALVPAGCELDAWVGRTFVSIVGFQFLKTSVLGMPIPFHRNFEEVNLRYYVRRKVEGTWRRGVVFVKELVPRPAIAWVARTIYGENYMALPMRHSMVRGAESGLTTLSYQWRPGPAWEGLSVSFAGLPSVPAEDAEESFITEHYWGYARQPDGRTVEYQVEHPRWAVWKASSATLACDVSALYGRRFAGTFSGAPSTAFVADGSAVVVRKGLPLHGGRELVDNR